MSVIGDVIRVCPICGTDGIRAAGKNDIACDRCKSVVSLVPDSRGGTLKVVVKKTSKAGLRAGVPLMTVPDMRFVSSILKPS